MLQKQYAVNESCENYAKIQKKIETSAKNVYIRIYISHRSANLHQTVMQGFELFIYITYARELY